MLESRNFVNGPRNLRLTWQDCWHLVLEFATRNVTLRVRWNKASDGVYDRIRTSTASTCYLRDMLGKQRNPLGGTR